MKNREFLTDRVPITKEEIRAISIDKLNLGIANTFLDIGSGTGSVTVQAANDYKNLKVISIEKNELAFELTKKNIEKFGLNNVDLIFGEAPVDIRIEGNLDAIFLGGSGPNLKEIIKWSYDNMTIGGKFVANFILIENFYDCLNIMEEVGFLDIECSQIYVSKLEILGKGRFFKPENPIFILSGTR